MLTPNDIRNVVFTKGMGGYKTSEVDVFIDECADTVEALIKEKNAAVEAFNREKQDLQKKLEESFASVTIRQLLDRAAKKPE